MLTISVPTFTNVMDLPPTSRDFATVAEAATAAMVEVLTNDWTEDTIEFGSDDAFEDAILIDADFLVAS